MRATVHVRPKPGILDPQGEAVLGALRHLDFAVSEVSSELHIWTHPTRAVDDWSEYRHRFDGAPAAAVPSSFRLAATRGGLGFVWKF